MTSNPFDRHREDDSDSPRDLKPGETRTILAKDKQGNVIKTMTLFRTERDYVHDLCDCYNAHRTQEAKERGLEWVVTAAGELKLSDDPEWSRKHRKQIASRAESERARHIRMQLEAARQSTTYQPEDA